MSCHHPLFSGFTLTFILREGLNTGCCCRSSINIIHHSWFVLFAAAAISTLCCLLSSKYTRYHFPLEYLFFSFGIWLRLKLLTLRGNILVICRGDLGHSVLGGTFTPVHCWYISCMAHFLFWGSVRCGQGIMLFCWRHLFGCCHLCLEMLLLYPCLSSATGFFPGLVFLVGADREAATPRSSHWLPGCAWCCGVGLAVLPKSWGVLFASRHFSSNLLLILKS